MVNTGVTFNTCMLTFGLYLWETQDLAAVCVTDKLLYFEIILVKMLNYHKSRFSHP